MTTIRGAGGALIALLVVNCAGNPFGGAAATSAQATDMPGRWILGASNAPSCGLNFAGTAGAPQGTVSPDGGCPGRFFTSRNWTLAEGTLIISDDDNQPLARLSFANGRYEGQASTGLPVSLSRADQEPL